MHPITPDIIVKIAQKWIGTQFHPQGRVMQVGVDCLWLIMGVAKFLAIKSKQGDYLINYDRNDYNLAQTNAREISANLNVHLEKATLRAESLKPGTVISFVNHKQHAHLGIITTSTTFIHACMLRNKVLEERIVIIPYRTKLWEFFAVNYDAD